MRRNISTRFRNIGRPNPLVVMIDRETERLQERHPRIRGFSVLVDKTHNRHHKGNQIRAQVLVYLPHRRILVSKEAEGMTESDNAAAALSQAFDATEHAVDRYLKKKRSGNPETPLPPPLSARGLPEAPRPAVDVGLRIVELPS
jgi:hypothetical protein